MTDQQPRLVDTGNDSFEVVESDGRVSVTDHFPRNGTAWDKHKQKLANEAKKKDELT